MRRAFTILELLAATALTALLMLAVLHVIGSVGRTRAAMARQPDTGMWRADLLDTLRRDFASSTGIRYEATGVTLTGHAALDRDTLATGDEPVTVVYAVESIAGRSWLCRRQTSRAANGQRAWKELLVPGVTTFAVRPAAAVSAVRPPSDSGEDAQAVPTSVVVEIGGPGETVLNETLVLR